MSSTPVLDDERNNENSSTVSSRQRTETDSLLPLPPLSATFYLVLGTVFVGCTLSGIVGGFVLVTSYLIEPTENTCSHWNSSITVIGAAVLFGSAGLTGFIIVPHVPNHSSRMWLVTCVVASGLGFGLCGVAVDNCHWSSLVTQIVYVVGYCCFGFGCFLPGIVASVVLVRWLPKLRSFAAGYGSMCTGVGSLAIAQLLIWSQTLVTQKVVDVASLFYGCGILAVLLIAIAVLLTVSPTSYVCAIPDATDDQIHCLKMTGVQMACNRQFILLFFPRFISPFCGFGLTARQQDFLDTIWRHKHMPTAILSASVFGSYIGGRLFWLVMSEVKSNRWCWRFSFAIQTVAIGCLPWFVYSTDSLWIRYAALIDFCLINITFSTSKMTTMGLCVELFGSVNWATAYGMSVLAYGLSGFLAPLIFELSLIIWSTYTPILYASAVANFVAFIASICLTPLDYTQQN